jgi:hypothetical protein
MANIGDRVTLTILRDESPGLYLDAGEELGDVLLPRREMPRTWEIGEEIEVFLYRDSEDRPVATMQHPKAMPGEFAYMEAIAVTTFGVFLEWGLQKDLLLPFGEVKEQMEVGKSYVVHVHVDPETDRIVASRRLSRYFSKEPAVYADGQEVDLILYGKTDLGYKAIINHECWGLLYSNELYRRVRKGQVIDGYIKRIREDGKIDLSLDQPGFSKDKMDTVSSAILAALQENDGFLALTDKSPPSDIYATFKVSKKVFKQAIGSLYKQRRIVLESTGIRLI